MPVQPISPKDIAQAKTDSLPDQIIECWNNAIVKNYSATSKSASIKQSEIVNELSTLMNVSRQAIFDNGWIEIEEVYKSQGWKVNYNKPDYTESWGAYFEFKK